MIRQTTIQRKVQREMNGRRPCLGIFLALCVAIFGFCASGTPVGAETFRYASQGSINQLDPYSLNETTTLAFLGNIYEGLVRRDENLKMEPALATSWEIIEPTRWRFHLRRGVKFHNGNDFTADDVIFSFARLAKEASDLRAYVPADMKVKKIDDYTVEFITSEPHPILHYQWETLYIMDKEWAKENGAVDPAPASGEESNFAVFNTNGTGPFILKSHQPGIKSVLKPNPKWWDTPRHNLTEAIFTPIASDATRVAALLSGEVDMISPVPVQDIKRLEADKDTKVLTSPELRIIFLGMDQFRDELLYSSVKGTNPLKDVRVRKAIYQAIDVDAIKKKVMRGLSEPAALMIANSLFAHSDKFSRFDYDPQVSKKLLTQAGYPEGFEITLDCPNDRYVNDEAICQAVVAMLSRVGVRATLNAQTKSKFFAKILQSGGYDTSLFLLGWTPSSYDYYNVLHNMYGCRSADGSSGPPVNIGGYCNEKLDALSKRILGETDAAKRDKLAEKAFRIATQDVAFVTLHQQTILWGVQENIDTPLREDDMTSLRFIQVK